MANLPSSSSPRSLSSASNSDNSISPKPQVVGGVYNIDAKNPELSDNFKELYREKLDKFKNYEDEYTHRLMAKYFSMKNIYGGNVFDKNVTIHDELIKSSRWPCTRSYVDPVQAFEDHNNNDDNVSAIVTETSLVNSNGNWERPELSDASLERICQLFAVENRSWARLSQPAFLVAAGFLIRHDPQARAQVDPRLPEEMPRKYVSSVELPPLEKRKSSGPSSSEPPAKRRGSGPGSSSIQPPQNPASSKVPKPSKGKAVADPVVIIEAMTDIPDHVRGVAQYISEDFTTANWADVVALPALEKSQALMNAIAIMTEVTSIVGKSDVMKAKLGAALAEKIAQAEKVATLKREVEDLKVRRDDYKQRLRTLSQDHVLCKANLADATAELADIKAQLEEARPSAVDVFKESSEFKEYADNAMDKAVDDVVSIIMWNRPEWDISFLYREAAPPASRDVTAHVVDAEDDAAVTELLPADEGGTIPNATLLPPVVDETLAFSGLVPASGLLEEVVDATQDQDQGVKE